MSTWSNMIMGLALVVQSIERDTNLFAFSNFKALVQVIAVSKNKGNELHFDEIFLRESRVIFGNSMKNWWNLLCNFMEKRYRASAKSTVAMACLTRLSFGLLYSVLSKVFHVKYISSPQLAIFVKNGAK